MIPYDEFKLGIDQILKCDEDFLCELLATVIKNPGRYTGRFRLSNARTKLIQNVTQSREIKFGDFMEDIVTEYIRRIGYENLNKNIGRDESGDSLQADQVFKKDGVIYLIEQKIRDDHDSTKKRGQYDNFSKKCRLLKRLYPDSTVDATMWFIDDSLQKNRHYYEGRANQENAEMDGITRHILYGKQLFNDVLSCPDAWDELCSHLDRNKQERSQEILNIPDFDNSPEILNALITLKKSDPALYRKLLSDDPKYVQLRRELFPTGHNLERVSAA